MCVASSGVCMLSCMAIWESTNYYFWFHNLLVPRRYAYMSFYYGIHEISGD